MYVVVCIVAVVFKFFVHFLFLNTILWYEMSRSILECSTKREKYWEVILVTGGQPGISVPPVATITSPSAAQYKH